MTLTLRCRGPSGQATLAGLSPSISVQEFQAIVHEKTGVAPDRQELLSGFPPKPLQLPANPTSATLSALPISNGDTITVRETAAASSASTATNDTSHDAELARALAASLAEAAAPALAAAKAPQPSHMSHPPPQTSTPAQDKATGSGGPAPTSISLPDGSAVVRRVIDSDNSCLFNSIGYVMDRTRLKGAELRRVIAEVVSSDPFTYNEGFLGMENDKYCKWILQSDKWGGAIELSILSQYYKREIAAYDIQTKRCDIYGQDQGHTERVMVLYDGLHYDAMAVAAFDGAPEELDVTILEPSSSQAQMVEQGAVKLVEASHKARQFTDTANFKLRCGVCQIGLKGEKEAVEHAKASGHQNFTEF